MSELPWYHEGLRFECTACGDCCTGAPGFVWVTDEEIEALARAVGLAVEDFEIQYVRRAGRKKSLTERPNGDCVFFDPARRGCSLYDARPHQCRTWPFWESNLRTPGVWKAVCRVCPGCNRGRLHTLEEIESQRAVVKV